MEINEKCLNNNAVSIATVCFTDRLEITCSLTIEKKVIFYRGDTLRCEIDPFHSEPHTKEHSRDEIPR